MNALYQENKTLTVDECERMFHCLPEELAPDMLVRDLETLVIPSWEDELG